MAVIRRRATALVGIAAASALVLSGCAASEEETSSAGGDSGSGSSEGLPAGCEAYEEYAGLSGTEVEIYTTIVSPEADLFNESFVEFEDCTGIDIVWNGSQEFEAQLPVRVAGGTAPDLAVFPQPGLLNSMVQTGEMVPASDKLRHQ